MKETKSEQNLPIVQVTETSLGSAMLSNPPVMYQPPATTPPDSSFASAILNFSSFSNVLDKSRTFRWRLLWFFVLFSFGAFFILQLYTFLGRLINRQLQMQVSIEERKYLPFPSFTILTNIRNKAALQKYGLPEDWTLGDAWGNESLLDLMNDLYYRYDEIIESVTMGGMNKYPKDVMDMCSDPNITENMGFWGPYYTITFDRRCYMRPGFKYGLWLRFNMELFDMDSFATVAVHNPLDVYSAYYSSGTNEEVVSLTMGQGLVVKLKFHGVKRINTNFQPCQYSKHGFSRIRCIEDCLWTVQVNQFGCKVPLMHSITDAPLCDGNTSKLIRSVWDFHESDDFIDQCMNKTCPKYCYREKFPTQVTSRQTRSPTDTQEFMKSTKVFFYYPCNTATMYEQEWSYELSNFISDIGGSLGIFLGMSLISFVEIIEGLTKVVKHKNTRRSNSVSQVSTVYSDKYRNKQYFKQ